MKPRAKPEVRRCHWAQSPLMIEYHDTEWGMPVHDDRRLFEFLVLEGAQAGLSWETILRKRENYRRAFDGFDVARVARYDKAKIGKLMTDPGIVRNRLKIAATIANAKAFLAVQKEYGSFDRYIWRLIGGKPVRSPRRHGEPAPVSTPESDAMSKALKKRGFKFIGTTICCAFMHAVGMMNGHAADCFRRPEIS